MRKKECDIGDKMLMNSSSKESFKQEEKTTTSHLPLITWCHHTPMMKVNLMVNGNILRMRKEYNIGDMMFMNSSSKKSFK